MSLSLDEVWWFGRFLFLVPWKTSIFSSFDVRFFDVRFFDGKPLPEFGKSVDEHTVLILDERISLVLKFKHSSESVGNLFLF